MGELSSTVLGVSLALCHYVCVIRYTQCVGVIKFTFVLFLMGVLFVLVWHYENSLTATHSQVKKGNV